MIVLVWKVKFIKNKKMNKKQYSCIQEAILDKDTEIHKAMDNLLNVMYPKQNDQSNILDFLEKKPKNIILKKLQNGKI